MSIVSIKIMPLATLSLLVASVALLAIFGGVTSVVVPILIVGAVVGLYWLLAMLRSIRLINFSRILAVSLLLGYGLGACISYISTAVETASLTFNRSFYGVPFSTSDLAIAISLIYVASWLLFIIAQFERPIFESKIDITALLLSDSSSVAVWGTLLIVLASLWHGDVGYMGAQESLSGGITALGALSSLVTPVFAAITGVRFANAVNMRSKLIAAIAFASFLFVAIILGRRVLLFTLILYLILLAASGRRVLGGSVRQIMILCASAFVGLAILYVGFLYFYSLRTTLWATGAGDLPISELVTSGWNALFSDFDGLNSALGENTAKRPFILGYLAVLVHSQIAHGCLWGRELIFSVQQGIPAVFFPNKDVILPAAPEDFTHPAFGIPLFDGPNTVMTAGLNDFGLLGSIFYPVLLVAMYMLICRLIALRMSALVYCILILRLMYQLFYVESSLSALLTTGLRDLFIVLLAYYSLITIQRMLRSLWGIRPSKVGLIRHAVAPDSRDFDFKAQFPKL